MARIVSDPQVMGGMPVIMGTRLPVQMLYGRLQNGDTVESILEDYPYLDREDIEAAVSYVEQVSLRSPMVLAKHLRRLLGRPLVARITGLDNPNIVTRWTTGELLPEPTQVNKMRIVVHVLRLLARSLGSSESAADWLTGDNSLLGCMPADAINNGDFESVFNAANAISDNEAVKGE